MDDPFFQPGNVALADAQCVGGLLLGALNAVRQTKAQLHDLPFPRGQAVHGPAQNGALRILLQPLADLVLITAQNIRKQQLVAVAIHVQRFVDAGFLTAVGAFA